MDIYVHIYWFSLCFMFCFLKVYSEDMDRSPRHDYRVLLFYGKLLWTYEKYLAGRTPDGLVYRKLVYKVFGIFKSVSELTKNAQTMLLCMC